MDLYQRVAFKGIEEMIFDTNISISLHPCLRGAVRQGSLCRTICPVCGTRALSSLKGILMLKNLCLPERTTFIFHTYGIRPIIKNSRYKYRRS